MSLCPCGSGLALDSCCGPILDGTVPAATAEALMRSRYSAFVLGRIDYLEQSLLPRERPSFDRAFVENWSKSATWQGLEIRSAHGGETDENGEVEFMARFAIDGHDQIHHETGRFQREDGRWYYVDGHFGPQPRQRKGPKVGRNDPCPCGSGKKYKQCCGR